MKMSFLPALIAGSVALLFAACGNNDENPPATSNAGSGGQANQPEEAGTSGSGGSTNPHEIPDSGDPGVIACATLGTLCHDFDTGSGDLGDQCHDVGHAGDPTECAAMYDECVAFCQADGGHDESDGGDAAREHSMCEEIGHICHDLDDGGAGLAHECHEVGHAGDELACAAIYAPCLAFCDPANAGDAGAALCEEIGHLCHALDDGGPSQAHECHEVGHGGDVAACALIYGDCVALCGGDGGH